jgi:hypothetical protein
LQTSRGVEITARGSMRSTMQPVIRCARVISGVRYFCFLIHRCTQERDYLFRLDPGISRKNSESTLIGLRPE